MSRVEDLFVKGTTPDVTLTYEVRTNILKDVIRQDVSYSDPATGIRNTLLQQIFDTTEEQVRTALIQLGWTPPSTGQIPIAELKVETQMISPPNPICYHVRVDGKSVALLLQGEVAQAVERFNSLLEKRRGPLVEKIPSVDIEDYYADPRS